MMIIDDTYSFYLLLLSNALLLCAATVVVLRVNRMLNRSNTFWNSPTGAHLRDVSSEDLVRRVVDERLATLQESVDELINKDGGLRMRGTGPFDNAVRMARQGAKLEEITRTCGLSQSEARLLLRIHARPDAAVTLN